MCRRDRLGDVRRREIARAVAASLDEDHRTRVLARMLAAQIVDSSCDPVLKFGFAGAAAKIEIGMGDDDRRDWPGSLGSGNQRHGKRRHI